MCALILIVSGGTTVKYLALVAACLLAFSLASPASAEDPTVAPTFTWPDVTSFNPDAHPYQVTVEGEGDYPYRLVTNGTALTITGPGVYAVPFAGSSTESTNGVRVYHCTDAGCGQPVATSPSLHLVRGFDVRWNAYDQYPVRPDDTLDLEYTLGPFVPGTTLRWYVVPAGADPADVLASGDVTEPASTGTATVTVPSSARDRQRFDVVLRAEFDGDAYGHLVGDSDRTRLITDTRAPRVRIKPDDEAFYPVAGLDDWGIPSTLEYGFHVNEEVEATLTFTGPDGVIVERQTGWDLGPSDGGGEWRGIDRHRVVYPEGQYEIRLDVVDAVGNAATASATVYLSHATEHPHRVTKIVTAASTLVDRSVGSCSSLTMPSSHGWKGSIGYASQSRCARTSDGNITTLHRIYLRDSFMDNYQMKVYYSGASARSRPGSRIASGFLTKQGTVTETNVSAPGARWNILPQVSPYVRTDARGRHYVLWVMGTGGGNRYDVRSFKYKLRYVTFT